MTKCTHCDATVLSSAGTELKYPSVEAMKAAVELEIHAAIGQVQTVAIGSMIQKAIDAALAAAPASWRSGATPAVGGEVLAYLHKTEWGDKDVSFEKAVNPQWTSEPLYAAQPASPLRGRESFEAFVKRAGFTDWSRYGDGYAKPLVDRMWSAWSASPPDQETT